MDDHEKIPRLTLPEDLTHLQDVCCQLSCSQDVDVDVDEDVDVDWELVLIPPRSLAKLQAVEETSFFEFKEHLFQ